MAVTLKGNNGTYEGTSEDNKPLDVPVNTEFVELDTGKTYYFDGETWNEEPPCEGSGFTPTAEQLAAMNSGITAEDVAQISTNENNISLNTAEITGQQNATTDTVAGRGYAIINGQRLYMGVAQMPERTGDIWLDGATVRESEYLLTANPLCGIDTYKDTLNLATGVCERTIDKLVLTGGDGENWNLNGAGTSNAYFSLATGLSIPTTTLISTHYEYNVITSSNANVGVYMTQNGVLRLRESAPAQSDLTTFKTWLAQQYAADNPVVIWYVLATSTSETITVPTGNTGTVEGYLIQDGTPTPTAPIYPTANEVPVWG